MLDNWRAPQTLSPTPSAMPQEQSLVQLGGASASDHD